jgi:hypothetical protein
VYKYDPDLVEGERWAVYDTRPYKVYTGIITQANTLLTLENTTGATFTYGNGNNEIVASSPVFTTNKTVVLATSSSNANGNTTVSANVFSTNIVQFKWVVTTGFGADVGDADSDTFVEIKVYP